MLEMHEKRVDFNRVEKNRSIFVESLVNRSRSCYNKVRKNKYTQKDFKRFFV